MNAGSGPTSPTRSAGCGHDPGSSSSKTSPGSSRSTGGEHYPRSSDRWPNWGMWDATGFTVLPKPEPPTSASAGSSLLPTPRASDGPHGSPLQTGTGLIPVITKLFPTPTEACGKGGRTSRSGTRKNEKLLNGIVQQLFPTPRVQAHAGGPEKEIGGRRPSGTKRSVNVETVVNSLFPTPATRDYKGRSLRGTGTIRSDTGKPRTVRQAAHPDAVLELTTGDLLLPTPMASANSKSTRALTASRENGRRDGRGQSSPLGLEEIAQIAAGHRVSHLPSREMLPPRSRTIIDSFQVGESMRPLSGDGN